MKGYDYGPIEYFKPPQRGEGASPGRPRGVDLKMRYPPVL